MQWRGKTARKSGDLKLRKFRGRNLFKKNNTIIIGCATIVDEERRPGAVVLHSLSGGVNDKLCFFLALVGIVGLHRAPWRGVNDK